MISLIHNLLVVDSMMTIDRDDSLQSISVKLNGKSYSYSSTLMKNFLKGKDCGLCKWNRCET